jgi:phage host-nuclease inhibitor protein Gam
MAKSARVRMPDAPALSSWDDVDLCLKEICECELAIEAHEANLTQTIQDLKMEADDLVKPYTKRIEELSRQIKEFTDANRTDIKGKTRELNFGRLGYRKSTKLVIKSVAKAIEALKGRKMTDCITVKESVNKDVLATYDDDTLLKVGAQKKIDDVFWYETDRERISAS